MRRLFVLVATLFALAFCRSPAAAAGPGALFKSVGGDFSAFYCSGAAALEHQNPYLVEPLRTCENRVQPNRSRDAGVVTPSPLPGYDLALFGILAHLPYALAKLVWFMMLFFSLAIAAFCLTQLSGFPLAFVLLVLVPVDGVLNFTFGQVPPIVVAALSLCAYLVERRRYVPAAFVAAATLIEPHIGLPVCLAMFLFLPSCRLPFGGLAVAFVAAALTVGGLAQNLAYFTTYLPAQAQSEVVAADQFSLTAALHLLGIPAGAALTIGTISYLLMLVVGIWLARHAALAFSSESFLVVLPAAAVLMGGTYVHDVQFAAALPAALLLCAKQRQRIGGWIVLGLLIVPWFTFATAGHTLGLLTRFTCALALAWIGILAMQSRPSIRRPGAAVGAVAAFLALLALATILPHRAPPAGEAIAPQYTTAQSSASDDWGAYLRATPALNHTSVREEFEKILLWLGLLGLLSLVAATPIRTVRDSARGHGDLTVPGEPRLAASIR